MLRWFRRRKAVTVTVEQIEYIERIQSQPKPQQYIPQSRRPKSVAMDPAIARMRAQAYNRDNGGPHRRRD